MKKLFDYLEAITPTLTDNQRKHIEMLVRDVTGNESQKLYNKGYLDGHTVGLKHGRVEGKMLSAGLSDEELEDFYKEVRGK